MGKLGQSELNISAVAGYLSGMMSKGFVEISKSESPFFFPNMPDPIYLHKPDTSEYSVIGSDAYFIIWDNDNEDDTEEIRIIKKGIKQ